jgi:hypothetical protein
MRSIGYGEGLSPCIVLMERTPHPPGFAALRRATSPREERGEVRKQARAAKRYTGKPACFASSFSDTCGRAPMCWITSAAASAPSRPAFS